ncbi:MAG: type II toxin-antitoxin system CcdA family antitoxin [Rhodocyclaceae bacterium]|nr:type II toxin-antitoxin system CcdA family antitoxin [Rhodocyclaceae bacterium]
MTTQVQSTKHQKEADQCFDQSTTPAEAKALEVNISKAAETGLAKAIAARRAELWLAENRAALDSSNTYFEKHGLPLAKYRSF